MLVVLGTDGTKFSIERGAFNERTSLEFTYSGASLGKSMVDGYTPKKLSNQSHYGLDLSTDCCVDHPIQT